jgi:hypothetical protein
VTRIFDDAGAKCPPEDGGISPLDLADLPPDEKKVMLTLLRDQGKSPEGVTAAALRMSVGGDVADFDTTLAALHQDGWLVVTGEADSARYRIAFRPKRGKGAYSLWSVLSDRTTNFGS